MLILLLQGIKSRSDSSVTAKIYWSSFMSFVTQTCSGTSVSRLGRGLISLAIAGLFAAHAPAADAQALLELMNAWQQAKVHDSQLKASEASINAAKERSFQANASNGLTVGASASYLQTLADTNKTPNNFYGSPSIGAQLSYPLYRPANLANIEAAKLGILAAQTQLDQQSLDLMVRVAQAYFDVLAAQDSLALLKAQKKAISEQLASAKRNFEVGTATITDQQEAQARFDLVAAQEISADNDLDVRKSALATLTGQTVSNLRGLDPKSELKTAAPNDENQWAMLASDSSYAVRLARVSAEIAKRDIERAAAAKKPTLDVVSNASLSRSSASLPGLVTRAASAGLQFSVPIFNGGSLDSRQREAIAQLDKAENDVISAQRAAAQSSRAIYKKLSSGLATVKALQQAEKSSQLALDSNQLGYQVGVRINIDVLNAQQQLFSTQRDLARARYEVLLDTLRLKQATGSLVETDLQAISALLTLGRAP
jgi:outer membrane protein